MRWEKERNLICFCPTECAHNPTQQICFHEMNKACWLVPLDFLLLWDLLQTFDFLMGYYIDSPVFYVEDTLKDKTTSVI